MEPEVTVLNFGPTLSLAYGNETENPGVENVW